MMHKPQSQHGWLCYLGGILAGTAGLYRVLISGRATEYIYCKLLARPTKC